MKKWISTILAVTMGLSLLAGCAVDNGSNPGYSKEGVKDLTLKIGVSTGEQDPRNIAAQRFAKEVEEKSGGAIKAVVYPSGQLGGDADMIDAVAMGSNKLDIVISDASNFATYEPKMGISALPFLFEDFETAWEFMDSDIEAQAEALLLDDNMRVLAHYCNGFRCMTNSIRPIETPDDMKGLLIRTPENPVIMATMNALGANAQPLPFSELYAALRQGTYDGQENPIPVIYNNNLYEVQDYLSITNHIYSGMCFTIAESTWEKLSQEQQDIVRTAALHSADADRKSNRAQTESLISELEKNNMIINEPDPEPFMEATQSVITSNASVYGDLMTELDEWRAAH